MRYQAFFAAVMAAAAVAATSGSSGAQTTGDKIEQKVDRATDKAANIAQDAKVGVSDSWLTAKTKIALFADERVKGSQVSVETVKGTIMLRGKVDSPEAKTAAESIAQGIDGAVAVKNDLQVVPPSARPLVDANDKDIKKAVENKLARDPGVKDVDVRADSGVVTLSGEVRGIGMSARASELARGVPGVRAVKNEVTFKDGRDADRGERRASRVAGSSAMGDTTGTQQHVRVMQQALKDKGYDPGPVDGVQGPRTTAALLAYQKAENITATGRADAETLGKLGIGVGGASTKGRQNP
jgi:hyperosmotically inducible protein